jgi:hypothetical protein
VSEPRTGYQRSAPGLVGAILICLALIGVVWALAKFQGAGGEKIDPTPTVDYSAELADARQQAPFEVLAPEPPPKSWRATSVDFEVDGPIRTWQLGFLTPDEDFVGLTQSNASSDDVVEGATRADQPGAPVTVGGEQWQTLTSSEDETALVFAGDDVTVVVTGTVDEAALVAFAESLRAD